MQTSDKAIFKLASGLLPSSVGIIVGVKRVRQRSSGPQTVETLGPLVHPQAYVPPVILTALGRSLKNSCQLCTGAPCSQLHPSTSRANQENTANTCNSASLSSHLSLSNDYIRLMSGKAVFVL